MNVFFDSSALAKRYVVEPGSNRVQEILSSALALGISVICISEIVSALCRLRREGRLTAHQYLQAKRALLADIEGASVVHITDQVLTRAVRLLEQWPLRSSDSLHVACAREWSAELFVSADERQCVAARAYGLRVEQVVVRD